LAASVPLYAAVLGLELPRLAPLWIAPRVAAALAAHGAPGGFAAAGFAEPSLMFLCGTDTQILGDGAQAADFLAAAPGRVVAVEARQAVGFARRAAVLGLAPRAFAQIDGVNYSNGRGARLSLIDRP
jgi:hypothetical protein